MRERIQSLDMLRGVAALSVCLGHYAYAFPASVMRVLAFGNWGVPIFFVISGFVIPMVLWQSAYSFEKFPQFLLKRLVRLHPPYLAALVLTLLLSYFSSLARHMPVGFSASDTVACLFYLKIPAENSAFWTLQVEILYYVFIGLTFRLWFSPRAIVRIATHAVFLTLVVLERRKGLPPFFSHFHVLPVLQYLPYFMLGFCLFAKERRLIAHPEFLATALASLIVIGATYTTGLVAVLFTAGVILLWKLPIPSMLRFFGMISYSLYLVHLPVGIKLINLLSPHASAGWRPVLALAALAVSIATACVLFHFVEKPAMELSGKIRFRQRQPELSPAA